MDFIVKNLTLLLFALALLVGFVVIRFINKRSLKSDELLNLVWQSVAISLTITYVIGTIDYVLSESTHFGFNINDVAAIIVPGALCLAILAGSVYYKYIRKPGRRGKKQ